MANIFFFNEYKKVITNDKTGGIVGREKKISKTRSLRVILEGIGKRLMQLRMEKGFNSVKQFAEKNGLPMIQYWRIEKGKANLTLKSLAKLLSIHSLSMEEFFCSIG